MAELGRQALVERDPASLMEAAVIAVARTLGVEYVAILELLPHDGVLLVRAGAGWEQELVGQATVSAGRRSPAGLALDADGPVVVPDLARETRCAVPPLLADRGVVAGAFVVIRGIERPYGVLAADATQPRAFSRDDIHFLRAVANVLADAIGRAQAEAVLRAAHDRDRRLRQRLEAHSRRIVRAQDRAPAHRPRAPRRDRPGAHWPQDDTRGLRRAAARVGPRPNGANDLTVDLLRRVHDLSLDLRPAMLDDLGLAPALVWLVERYTVQTGVEVSLDCSGLAARLDPQVETAAYRIVQEALTNVARHAGVKSAAVACSVAGSALHVEVADDGGAPTSMPSPWVPAAGWSVWRSGLGRRAAGCVCGPHEARAPPSWPAADLRVRAPGAVTIRLVLADDHPLVGEGLRALLEADPEFSVVAEAGDGVEVPALVDEYRPDVVVLDLMMPGRSGLDVTRELAQHADRPPVLILRCTRAVRTYSTLCAAARPAMS